MDRKRRHSDVTMPCDETHLVGVMREINKLWSRKEHCDLVIQVGKEKIPVHRLIIVSSSAYLREKLNRTSCFKNLLTILELKDMDPVCVKLCINFIYTGMISVKQESREKVYETAVCLEIPKLCDHLEKDFARDLDLTTFFPTRKLAIKNQCADLERKCDEFALANFSGLSQLQGFHYLTQDYVRMLIESGANESSETEKLMAVLSWTKFDSGTRTEFFCDMLELIGLNQIKANVIVQILDDPIVLDSFHSYKMLSISVLHRLEPCSFREPEDLRHQEVNTLMVTDGRSGLRYFNTETNSWSKHQPFGRHIGSFSATYFGNDIFLITANKETYKMKFIPRRVDWMKMSDMNVAHGDYPHVLHDLRYLYVLGNCDGIIERYDPYLDKWTVLTLKTLSEYCSAVYLNCKIYCIGGLPNRNCLNSVEVYDLISKKRSMIAPVHGGSMNCVNSVEVYDLISKNWSLIAPLRFARSHSASTAHHDKIYVFGGCRGQDHAAVDFVECLNPETDKVWTTLKPMPTKRGGAGFWSVSIREDIFIVGGLVGQPVCIDKFSVPSDEWSSVVVPKEISLSPLCCVSLPT